jgi:sulfonate transport system permease protein
VTTLDVERSALATSRKFWGGSAERFWLWRALGAAPWLPVVGLAAFFGFWEAATWATGVSQTLLPPPSVLPAAWWGELEGGYWLKAVQGSLGHYATGLALGSFLGIAFGVLVGLFERFAAIQSWIARVLRPIPGLAWIPFAIIWFGVSPAGAVFIIAIAVFWLNYFATAAAVQSVDPDIKELAAAFGHTSLRAQVFKAILPASAAGILGGFRAGLGQAWMAVVAAELFGVPGVGARMMQAASVLATDVVVVYMLTMALLYGLSDTVFVLIQRRLLAWRP